MAHPLVDQLRFSRAEFKRGLDQVADPQASHRFGVMNSISWMVGHLAWQEQRYWLERAQGKILVPELNELLAYGKPASTPPVGEMWDAWHLITRTADPWLDELTTESIQEPLMPGYSSTGTYMLRTIYHYWYHLGEGMAVRQQLGHTQLPEFVGEIDTLAPYRPDIGQAVDQNMDKDQLIRLITETRSTWNNLVSQVGDQQMLVDGVSGYWSLKDVIAHLSWHEREIVHVLNERALLGSDLWQLPLDQRNQAIYEQLHDLPLEQVIMESQQVFHSLLHELDKLDEADLHDPLRFREFPAEWRPWDLIADNTYRHYQDHLADLEAWLAKHPLSSA